MYAVVTTGGKQYRVEAGSELIVERLAAEPGASITFDRVLLIGDGEAITVGSPTVDGASVSGTVIGEELGPKLIIFKFKQKVKYRRTAGHRQHLTRVRVDEISAGGKRSSAERVTTDATAGEKAAGKKAAAEATTTDTKAEAAPAKPVRTRKPAAPEAKAGGKADGVDAASAKSATRRRTTAKDGAKKAQAEE
jgi:large subunit ribosomal protein L21